ncbi:O-antigen ligase [Chryseobacterium camelliae]|uniref:O-antigen ligase n=1 Tax=Chryseobacterium camelliae TaxID=1265445 RepID=A0ABY7QRX9_9FLAO|nr:O-antigen polymerase [Chryseobacterium camelliae]WBV61568.1 O-antigen ligase [Chryseobacterium camelliae]
MTKEINFKKFFSMGYTLVYLIFFCFLPLYYHDNLDNSILMLMIAITLISIIIFVATLNSRIVFGGKKKYFYLDFDFFSKTILSIYVIVVMIILITAPSIPIIEAFKGTSQGDLIMLRESFLKTRTGWESILPYIITVLDSAIIPYIIIESFLRKSRNRFFYLIIFLMYSISFLEKAYLFKIIIPLMFYLYTKAKNRKLFLIRSGVIILGFLSFMFTITQFGGVENSEKRSFFSIEYIPTGILDAIVWRSFVVPVRTSYDALLFFQNEFSDNLLGATSNLIATLTLQERINFERLLYFNQFGGNGTGNANFCFIEDAYINFSFVGVIFFSFLAGSLTRMTLKSRNLAAISILPFFLFQIYNVSFIANFLNNGYFIFFFIIKFVKFRKSN